jgi:repressor LexA
MRSADGLSQRQEQILAYIRKFWGEKGYAPAIRDIQKDLHISSTSVVAYNLKILEQKEKILRDDKISRGITLPGALLLNSSLPATVHTVPLLGVITAGSPLPDPEDIAVADAERIEVPADMVDVEQMRGVYALRVRGYSMIDALIDDGDLVLLRYQPTADNGQMVAVRLLDDNAVTLKKFYHEGDRVRLQPANVTMEPIYTSPENLQIQGRVVGVIRNLG